MAHRRERLSPHPSAQPPAPIAPANFRADRQNAPHQSVLRAGDGQSD
ncbi:hypothetical protein [Calothrix sp. 336/3]